jgi:hypothetical protein
LENGANSNLPNLVVSAANEKRSDVLRLLLLHGAIYEYKYEYIDKETMQQVSKIVRFNDPQMTISKKYIISLIPMPLSPDQEAYYKQLKELPFSELT